MSIAAQCTDCCECPQPTVQWDSRSASKSKLGFTEFTSPSTPPKYYLRATPVGWIRRDRYANADCTGDYCAGSGYQDYRRYDVSGASVYDPATGALTGFTWTQEERFCDGSDDDNSGTARLFVPNVISLVAVGDCSSTSHLVTESLTPTVATWTACTNCRSGIKDSGVVTQTLSDEYTTALLKTTVVASLPAYDDDWNDTAGSFSNLSSDELSIAVREARYRIRFKIPKTNTGLNYRATWVERFIPEAGVGITSVEVRSPGVYRPGVTLSAPPAGGTQARAVAVMSSTGTVASIRVLNPGSGYTSAPTVTVQAATGGGTSSTGWTATLSGGTVSAITGGSAGNYLPTLAFSSGGGSGATATCTMDAQGGIASVSLGAAGSGYTSEPTLTITAKVSGSTAADLLLHLGTETARCAVWDGVTPGGYDPATPSTYPIIGDGTNPYWSLAVPSSDGTTLVANLRAVCDGSAC